MTKKTTLKNKLTALAVGAPLLSVGFVGLAAAPASAVSEGDAVQLLESTDAYLSPDAEQAEGQIHPGLGYVIAEPDDGSGFTGVSYADDPDNVFYVETSSLDIEGAGGGDGGNGSGDTGNGNGGNGDGSGDNAGGEGNGGTNGGGDAGENGGDGSGNGGEETVEASISLSDGSVAPGESVNLTGEGFAPNESVNISLGTEYPAFITATASEDGVVDYGITIPSDIIDGEYEVLAEGADSGNAASATLSVLTEGDANGAEEGTAEEDPSAEDGEVAQEETDGFVESDEDEGDPTQIEAGFIGGDNTDPAALGGLLGGLALVGAGGAAFAMRSKKAAAAENNS